MLHTLLIKPLALQSREELGKVTIVNSVGSSGSLKERAITLISKLINLVSHT